MIVLAKGFGQKEQEVGYSFIIENPDPTYAYEDSEYHVALYDTNGTVLKTDSGYINMLLAGQQLGVSGSIYLDEGVTATKMEVQLNQGNVVEAKDYKPFTVENGTYFPNEYSPTVRGLINNPYEQDVRDLKVSAVLYNSAGEIIGGGNAYLNFILANSSTGVAIYVTSSGEVSRVDIYPSFSGFYELDIQEQLPEGASKLVLSKQGYGQDGTNLGIGMILENHNQAYAIENSMYHATSFSEDGTILAVSEGYLSVLLPGQTLGVADAQYLNEDVIVSRVDIQIKEGDFTESSIVSTFSSENISFLPDEYSPRVTGEIVNPYSKELSYVRVDAIAYNDIGDIIGSGLAYLDFVPANSKTAVEVYITVSGTPAKVELYAVPSMLSDIED
jgi:hypothetical protein